MVEYKYLNLSLLSDRQRASYILSQCIKALMLAKKHNFILFTLNTLLTMGWTVENCTERMMNHVTPYYHVYLSTYID